MCSVEPILVYGWILDFEENYLQLLELEGIDREKIDDLDELLENYIREKYNMDFGYVNPSYGCDIEDRIYFISYPDLYNKESMKKALETEESEDLIDLLINLNEDNLDPEIHVLTHFPDETDYFEELVECWVNNK